MPANKDAAKEVYTPDHETREVASFPETIPSGALDGTDCSGFNGLAFTRKHGTATTSQYRIYYYDNNDWIVGEDSASLAAADYTPTDAEFFQQYNLLGVWRYKVVMMSADGTVRVTENISV